MEFFIILVIILLVYFLPTIVVLHKNKHNGCSIIIINIFLGWTFIGWVVALAWACADDN